MNTNEEMKMLYEELIKHASIDEIMDAIEELMVNNYNGKTNNEPECDGDCENCKYGYEDDSDEYEYSNIYNDELIKAYERAQNDFEKSIADTMEKYDSVNHPSHYASGKIEVIDFIEDKKLGYNLGNCIKYISRAGKKHEDGMSDLEKAIEDLEKARWYLEREINTLKKQL